MSTMIYSPGVRVYIQSSRRNIGLIDVSEDISEGTMVRRSDGVSTFNFTLNNPQRKYDSVFTPNDRIVVMMKRLTWVRTFTGLLNSVPLVSAWPRTVPLSASCSLKRLQYWFWDSNAPATQELIRSALAPPPGRGSDGGVTNVVLTILKEVVGWPASKVHIAGIPDDWFDIAKKVAAQVDLAAEESDALRAEFEATLGGSGSIAGSSVSVNGTLQGGNYGGTSLTREQCGNAEVIYTVCKSMGGSDRDAVMGIACSLQESSLKNLQGGDRDSVGLFQQRPSQGWGTVAQCTTPTYAARKFFEGLLKVGNRTSMTESQAIQTVQRSADGSLYQHWVPTAKAMVSVLAGQATSGAGPATAGVNLGSLGATAGTNVGISGAGGVPTGQTLANVGVALVEKYPNIPYTRRYVGTNLANILAEPPPGLDCSGFCQSIYVRTLGSNVGNLPHKASLMDAWCRDNGGTRLTAAQALATPGAFIFPNDLSHIEISLGNGSQTVGTGSVGGHAKVSSWGTRYWGHGYTVPNISYPGGVGGNNGTIYSASDGGIGGVGGTPEPVPTTGKDAPGWNADDPFDQMFGNNNWIPQTAENDPAMALAESLTGVRALMNDQPLMPYLMNLFNSTMRSFCSAPNGDLIAWFPDYYGLWGTAAKMVVEPIEMQDFTVEWSDDFFVTHQFTLAGQVNYLDVASGTGSTEFATTGGADIRTQTLGIANIDIPALMYSLFGIDASPAEAQNFANYIYKRFGARPAYNEMPGLIGHRAEFFAAIFMFMRQWAYQYNADIPLTFMPELWPGMLIQIPSFDFQAYVTTVTHSFRFGQGGGFQTTVNIAAPARLPKKKGDRDNVLIGLPLAGNYKPGRGASNLESVSVDNYFEGDFMTRVNGGVRRLN